MLIDYYFGFSGFPFKKMISMIMKKTLTSLFFKLSLLGIENLRMCWHIKRCKGRWKEMWAAALKWRASDSPWWKKTQKHFFFCQMESRGSFLLDIHPNGQQGPLVTRLDLTALIFMKNRPTFRSNLRPNMRLSSSYSTVFHFMMSKYWKLINKSTYCRFTDV